MENWFSYFGNFPTRESKFMTANRCCGIRISIVKCSLSTVMELYFSGSRVADGFHLDELARTELTEDAIIGEAGRAEIVTAGDLAGSVRACECDGEKLGEENSLGTKSTLPKTVTKTRANAMRTIASRRYFFSGL